MKRTKQPEKKNLHPRNQHRLGYDFDSLIKILPELKNFAGINEHQIQTLDFSNPDAVKALNKALLLAYYDIHFWEIPSTFLCPPIPGRVDYIHYLADLLAQSNNGIIPKGEAVQGLDIGVGANCIYPILGNAVYGWSFVGTDIDEKAIQNCKKIIEKNPRLMDAISLQLQTEPRFIFKNIMESEDKFAFTIATLPFIIQKKKPQK